jgi:hypothetical protein
MGKTMEYEEGQGRLFPRQNRGYDRSRKGDTTNYGCYLNSTAITASTLRLGGAISTTCPKLSPYHVVSSDPAHYRPKAESLVWWWTSHHICTIDNVVALWLARGPTFSLADDSDPFEFVLPWPANAPFEKKARLSGQPFSSPTLPSPAKECFTLGTRRPQTITALHNSGRLNSG